MNARLGTAAVVTLSLVVALLAIGLNDKLHRTAVSAQRISAVPTVTPTAEPAPPKKDPSIVFIGDFTDGSNEGGKGGKNWTALLGDIVNQRIRVRIVADSSGGGSGYVVRGSSPTFADQVRRLVTPDATLVAISGSRNDVVADPAAVTASALETFGLVRSFAPRAGLIVIGPTWGRSEPNDEILRARDAVRDAAEQAGALFVDPIADAWFTNGDPGLIGADNVHPTDAGNSRIAELLLPVFAAALNPST